MAEAGIQAGGDAGVAGADWAMGTWAAGSGAGLTGGDGGARAAGWVVAGHGDAALARKVWLHREKIGLSERDSMEQADWHRFHASLTPQELAVVQADYLRCLVTKAKQAEHSSYWAEGRSERLAVCASDVTRRFFNSQGEYEGARLAGDQAGMQAARDGWRDFRADWLGRSWSGTCFGALGKTVWLLCMRI